VIAQMQWLAGMDDRPTAIVCANGILTPGMLHGLNVAGLRIPSDISVVTYGDSEWHEAYNPPISVIRHDYIAAGSRGVRRLVARIENEPDPDIPRQPSEFVSRASTGPPPTRVEGAAHA
jgi:DNA-binding LacI/PurR family transcriptional regulator